MNRSLAYRLLDASGLNYIAQRRWNPAGVIFMLHSVGETCRDDFCPNAAWRISAHAFTSLIQVANEFGYRAVSIEEALCSIDNPEYQGPPFYAVTFDDGYADNLHIALPIAKALQIPITVYVTSGFITRTHHAWWHILEDLVKSNQSVRLTIDGQQVYGSCHCAPEKNRLFTYLAGLLRSGTEQTQQQFVADVRANYGDAIIQQAEAQFLSASELSVLSSQPEVTIGAHGHTHVAMANLSAKELYADFQSCLQSLYDLTAVRPLHYAYPFGGHAEARSREFAQAKALQLKSAVTTHHGAIQRNRRYNSRCLPRIPVFPSDNIHSIRCKLSGLSSVLYDTKLTLKRHVSLG